MLPLLVWCLLAPDVALLGNDDYLLREQAQTRLAARANLPFAQVWLAGLYHHHPDPEVRLQTCRLCQDTSPFRQSLFLLFPHLVGMEADRLYWGDFGWTTFAPLREDPADLIYYRIYLVYRPRLPLHRLLFDRYLAPLQQPEMALGEYTFVRGDLQLATQHLARDLSCLLPRPLVLYLLTR